MPKRYQAQWLSELQRQSIVRFAVLCRCDLMVLQFTQHSKCELPVKAVTMLKEIENRRSVRKYLNKKVEKEKLVQLLESARLAPSGSNTQPWTFLIIESEDMKEKLSIADHHQKWMMTAPIFIVCVADIRYRIPWIFKSGWMRTVLNRN